MKRIMYASIAIMCLSIAVAVGIHIGHQTAEAQGAPEIVGYQVVDTGSDNNKHQWVLLSNGDVYSHRSELIAATLTGQSFYAGNIFGTTVPAVPSTLGDLKGNYGGKD